MAEVTSGDVTVIVLDKRETRALNNMLDNHLSNNGMACRDIAWLHLDELTNALAGIDDD